ncbi:MAG: DUF2892 domain-containing protein [Planctomycetes bacterium]|nr:DUF2892 domain-containing protein [Planctomycetota bacterium]
MTLERWMRVIAGTFILLSLLLATFASKHWLWFTAFVGLNLFQSGISGWCFMETLLRRSGVGGCPANETSEQEYGT